MLTLSIAYHEGGPPAAIPDLVGNSIPRLVVRPLLQALTLHAENLDKSVGSAFLLNVQCLAFPGSCSMGSPPRVLGIAVEVIMPAFTG